MKTIKESQVIQKEQEDNREASTYIPPKIMVYKEEDILKTVAVLGCSPNPF